MRLKLSLLLMLLVSVSAAYAQPSDWKLDSAQPLPDLLKTSVRGAALSVDGSMLAWADVANKQLCIYTFASDEQTCHPFPENYTGFNQYSYLSWSPDGETLVFTEDPFVVGLDSDIWTYNIRSGIGGDRTDDNFFGGYFNHSDSSFTLDYLPAWNPTGGGIYFFRSIPAQSKTSLILEYLPLVRTEPKQIVDLSGDFPAFSVYRQAVISPDGSHMAIIVLSQQADDPQNGVWTIDLTDGALEQVMTLDHFTLGLPDWALHPFNYPEIIQWAGNDGLVVWAQNQTNVNNSIQNAYYVGLSAESVTSLIDFTSIPDVRTYIQKGNTDDPTQLMYQSPRAGVVSPDGSAYIYIGFGGNTHKAYVWSQKLPPDKSGPTLLSAIDPFQITPAANTAPAISADGQHALLFGYWLTLEPPA